MSFLKPSIKNATHPEDIIGDLSIDFVAHYRKTYRCRGVDDFKKAVSGFGQETRNAIGRIYELLHKNGWYPMGFDEYDNIKWAYRSTWGEQGDQSKPIGGKLVSPGKMRTFLQEFQIKTRSSISMQPEDYYENDPREV